MGLVHQLSLPLIEGLFPDPESALEDGVVCTGGPLEVSVLVTAYYNGIFPWPHPGLPLLWFSPDPRGVLEFKNLHISKSLAKSIRKNRYSFTFNQAFTQVIDSCAKVPRREGAGTWITKEMKTAYLQMHRTGFAHSVEAWRDETLVGGIYGVFVAGVFSGESMFALESDVSKMCLVKLVEYLSRLGLEWMDIQMVTPVTGALGGQALPRSEFLKRIRVAHKKFNSQKILTPAALKF